jgi:hypothetical protein
VSGLTGSTQWRRESSVAALIVLHMYKPVYYHSLDITVLDHDSTQGGACSLVCKYAKPPNHCCYSRKCMYSLERRVSNNKRRHSVVNTVQLLLMLRSLCEKSPHPLPPLQKPQKRYYSLSKLVLLQHACTGARESCERAVRSSCMY